jgi:hypothetical protein
MRISDELIIYNFQRLFKNGAASIRYSLKQQDTPRRKSQMRLPVAVTRYRNQLQLTVTDFGFGAF